MYDMKFMRLMEEESLRPEYEDIQFMRVHCRKHLRFCVNKIFAGRITPMAELYMLNENGDIILSDIDTFHRSAPGIRGFFEDSGVIEQEFHPEAIMGRCGSKLLDIVWTQLQLATKIVKINLLELSNLNFLKEFNL